MKFVVVGTGGVGGYFGAKLATGGEDVWFMARGKHLAAMRAAGLHVHATDGDMVVPAGKMTDAVAEIGPADVVLFCVKSYDTESAARLLGPIVTKDSIIISLQNGVSNEEMIQKIIPERIIFGGVAYIYSLITAPGVITETGGPKKIVFGPMTSSPHTIARSTQILEVMLHTGIHAEVADDISAALWKKFIFIAAVGGLTAMTRLTLGEMLAVHETRNLLREAMEEADTVARALHVNIEHGYVGATFETLSKFNNNTRSSLYYDLVNGKPMEIDALSGTVLRYGERLGISTPIHRAIYAALLPYHRKHSHQPIT
jgi:2-dehydropantoate 2-reductase